ncbi:MAG TPA: hypothetical protein VMM17_07080 [Gemmatimonadaceae bacterium]|nr:hypothetical protein [Gemmatimonadaceae bacterium]
MEAFSRSPESLRALLTRIVDYAGLFPPAQLGMKEAVGSYAGYLAGPHRWMLGRFVVPAVRLDEFEAAAARHFPRGQGSQPWQLSALVGIDVRADVDRMLRFNCSHWEGSATGHAVIDAAELRVAEPGEIEALASELPRNFRYFFEHPLEPDPEPFIAAAGRAGAGVKARTGGVTAAAFPGTGAVARFLAACVGAGVRFKVTAGLHHPVRGEYRLTYERDAPCGTMLGYLNVFLAAAALAAGESIASAHALLERSDLEGLAFEPEGVRWGDLAISGGAIERARELAVAFGSCSFREPVDELIAAGLLE